jgi:hypothetical protein
MEDVGMNNMNDDEHNATSNGAADDANGANGADTPDGGFMHDYEPIYIDKIPDTVIADEFEVLARKRRTLGAIMLAIIVAGIIGFIVVDKDSVADSTMILCGVALMVTVIILAVVYNHYNMQAKKLVSENITIALLRETFTDVEYNYNEHIDKGTIRESQLIPRWKTCTGSDLVEAEYRGIEIAFSDICLTHTERSGDDDEKTVTDFEGQWLTVRMAKSLQAQVRLIERSLDFNLFANKSDVETESIEFNKKYRILTDDPHTAFYVLTPHFMEYINAMDARASARTYMWFVGNMVHVAIDSRRNLFEDISTTSLLKPAGFDSLRNQFRGEIRYVTSIVDELLLNEYLFGE